MTKTTDFVTFIVDSVMNDGAIYRQQGRPIALNLARKKVKGIYKTDLAVKLCVYLAESGIKKYKKQFAEYYEVPASQFARVPQTVKVLIAKRLLQDMTPEINDAARDMKNIVVKKKTPAKKRR